MFLVFSQGRKDGLSEVKAEGQGVREKGCQILRQHDQQAEQAGR